MYIVIILVSYLIGAIPFGLLLGRLVGADVRQAGSGNIGATNVGRLLGRKLGVLTLVLDILKAFLPMLLASYIVPENASKELVVSLCGLAAVSGHMFPVYLGFKGGKGVAAGLGAFLFLSPGAIGISLLVFVAVVAGSGFVSAGSLVASGLIPLWIWLLGGSRTIILVAGAVALLIWLKHYQNIGRLLRGEEKGWKKS